MTCNGIQSPGDFVENPMDNWTKRNVKIRFSEESMEGFEVHQINNLLDFNLADLVKESKEDGFRFLERLISEYKNGTNNFNKPGEFLYGVFKNDGQLIAIGGLNIDPCSGEQQIGRLRRFYVFRDNRRNGVGRLLLDKIICNAKNHYNVLVLHTDTEQANKFYISLGFLSENLYPNSTHHLKLV